MCRHVSVLHWRMMSASLSSLHDLMQVCCKVGGKLHKQVAGLRQSPLPYIDHKNFAGNKNHSPHWSRKRKPHRHHEIHLNWMHLSIAAMPTSSYKMCILTGAVHYGTDPDLVHARRARMTYGVRACMPYEEGKQARCKSLWAHTVLGKPFRACSTKKQSLVLLQL